MAITTGQVSVGTTATALSTAESDDRSGSSICVSNPSGGSTVYLGPAGVTTGNGFALDAGASMAFDLQPGELIYGIVASGTVTVSVLRTGV